MEIINVIPRGYCQGVVRAIKIAKDTAEKYSDYPISMLGMLVHNQYVVPLLRKKWGIPHIPCWHSLVRQ